MNARFYVTRDTCGARSQPGIDLHPRPASPRMSVAAQFRPDLRNARRCACGGIRSPRAAARPGWAIALVVAALSPGMARAQAGPPYQTDDPDPVEYRHWELYVASQDASTPGAMTGTAPHLEANYGALPGLQLHLLVPLAYALPTGGHAAYGPGDVEVGAKLRVVTEGRWRPMVGTFVQTEWPVGSAAEGLATPALHVLLPLWLQKSFGAWSTDVGGGDWIDFDHVNGNYWATGWELQRHVSGHATLGGELYHTTAHRITPARLLSNLGLVLDLTDHDHLLFSVGHSLAGPRTSQVYAGFQLTGGR